MIATNVKWDVDEEDIENGLLEMSTEYIAKILDLSVDDCINKSPNDIYEYTIDLFHHCPAKLDDFLLYAYDIPAKIEIPECFACDDIEEISDWLSDEYGFCHNGFCLEFSEKDMKQQNDKIIKLKTQLTNAIDVLYQKSSYSYEGLNDENFIAMICEEIGMTKKEYGKLFDLI